MERLNWTNFKTLCNSRSLRIQYIELDSYYTLRAFDQWFHLGCHLLKDGGADVIDFETNFKSTANQSLSDTQGFPLIRTTAFSNTDNMRFRGTGISKTISAGTTDNLDYKLPENRFLNGVQLIVKNHIFADKIKFQVIDKDNILGFGTNVVLDEFATDWHLAEDTQNQGQFIVPYPALINANLYIRLVYISTGTTDVELACNLFLHKKP